MLNHSFISADSDTNVLLFHKESQSLKSTVAARVPVILGLRKQREIARGSDFQKLVRINYFDVAKSLSEFLAYRSQQFVQNNFPSKDLFQVVIKAKPLASALLFNAAATFGSKSSTTDILPLPKLHYTSYLHAHVLLFREETQRLEAAFPTDATVLHAAEWRPQIAKQPAVDPHDTGFES